MSRVWFGDDDADLEGRYADSDGQSLCGWAFDVGREHQKALEAERGAWVSTVVRVAVERERERWRSSLERLWNVLRAEIAMPHVCSDCGWHVGGVPRGIHNTGCRVANAADEAMNLLMPPFCPRSAGRGDPEHEGACGECGR
jgi:hypothetical protein